MKKALFAFIVIFALTGSFKAFSQWNFERDLASASYSIMLSDFSFSSPQNGFVIHTHMVSPSSGNIFSVIRTTDYFAEWDQITQYVGGVSSSQVISTDIDTVFYILNHQGVFYFEFSFDGGAQWQTRNLGFNMAIEMFFVNGHCGYFLTSDGLVNKIWKFDHDLLSVFDLPDTIKLYNTADVFFIDSMQGFIAAEDSIGNNLLLHTVDGGVSWNTQFSTSQYSFNDFVFTSLTTGYIACEGGTILKTVDGGITFAELTVPTSEKLLDIDFINDSCGYCVGLNGVCISTVNGGQSWTTETIPTTSGLKKIQMFDQNTGYILSEDHKIYSKGIYESAETVEQNSFQVYPNPVDDNMFVSFKGELSEKGTKCSLYNCHGVLLCSMEMTENDAIFNVQNFPAGIYYLTFVSENMQHTEKVLVY